MSEATNADKNNAAGLLDQARRLVVQARALADEEKDGPLTLVAAMLSLRATQLADEVWAID